MQSKPQCLVLGVWPLHSLLPLGVEAAAPRLHSGCYVVTPSPYCHLSAWSSGALFLPNILGHELSDISHALFPFLLESQFHKYSLWYFPIVLAYSGMASWV